MAFCAVTAIPLADLRRRCTGGREPPPRMPELSTDVWRGLLRSCERQRRAEHGRGSGFSPRLRVALCLRTQGCSSSCVAFGRSAGSFSRAHLQVCRAQFAWRLHVEGAPARGCGCQSRLVRKGAHTCRMVRMAGDGMAAAVHHRMGSEWPKQWLRLVWWAKAHTPEIVKTCAATVSAIISVALPKGSSPGHRRRARTAQSQPTAGRGHAGSQCRASRGCGA
jgi:hypothetical protein